ATGNQREKCSPGGGVYELTASNPEVLGKFGIDVETIRLLINPASVGESSLVITDVLASTTVTLRVKLHVLFNSFDCRILSTKTHLNADSGKLIWQRRNIFCNFAHSFRTVSKQFLQWEVSLAQYPKSHVSMIFSTALIITRILAQSVPVS
ncbi:MAG: hypothetical protein K2I54_05140, partial [Muribaculaceae bacterium]|nr:hypothetical protein [Muribaculaceae bacterium]